MVEWPIKKVHVLSFEEESLGPSWIPNQSSKTKELPERISNTIMKTGSEEELLKELINLIKRAKHTICISSFILSESRMIEAILEVSQQGKNVYVLTASEQRLKDESLANSEYEREEIQLHKQILDRFAGKVLVRTSPDFHAKYILTDPNDSKQCAGYLLTPNLARNTFNNKLEIGVCLNQQDIQEFFKHFLIGFWELSEHELIEQGRIRSVPSTESPTISFPNVPCTLKTQKSLKKEIYDLIRRSKGPIYLASFSFEKEHEIVNILIQEAKTRDVYVFSRPRPFDMVMDTLIYLDKNNIKVYGHPGLHAKGILGYVKKKPEGIVMTANLHSMGLETGFEVGTMLTEENGKTLERIFLNWKDTFPEILKTDYKLKDYIGKFRLWTGTEFAKKEVKNEFQKNLGVFQTSSFDDLNSLIPPFPKIKDKTYLYQTIKFEWENSPPLLPKNSQFKEKINKLDTYTYQGNIFIAISKPKEYEKALSLSKTSGYNIVLKA